MNKPSLGYNNTTSSFNNKQFYELLMQAPAFIAVLKGPEHIFEAANIKYQNLIGRDRKLIGLPVTVALPEAIEQGFVQILDQVYETGIAFQADEMCVKIKKSESGILEDSYLDFVYQPIFEDESIIGIFVHGVDVTEKVVSRKTLIQSEAHFRLLADNMSQLAWIADKEGSIFWFNRRWLDYTGTTLQEVKEWDWESVQHPDHLERVVEKYKQAIKDKTPWEDQFPLKDNKGEYHWFLSRALPIIDEKGEILYWFGTNTDISSQRDIEESLRYQKSLFEALQEASPMAMLVVAPDGSNSIFNQQFINLWNLPTYIMEAGINYLVLEMVSELLENPGEFIKSSQSPNKNQEKIIDKLILKDGRIVERYGSPISSNYGYVWFFNDITDKELLLRQKDDFLGIASHELKTPISSLKGYTEVLEMQMETMMNDHQKKILQRMTIQIDKVTYLINSILDSARIGNHKIDLNKKNILLNDVITEVYEDISSIHQNLDIKIEMAENFNVNADRDRISQVIINLLTNAIKYAPHSNLVKLKAIGEEGKVIVSVEDFGIGLEQKEQKEIFERFYRVKGSSSSGLGLGLFICKDIIQKHDGDMWVESEPGKGSKFFFSLPL